MSHTKRTYALPAQIMTRFEHAVPAGERSRLVGKLLQDWLDDRERKALRADLAEGCRAMADIHLETEKEFHPLEEEVHRGVEDEPKTRRRSPGKTRSGRRIGTSR